MTHKVIRVVIVLLLLLGLPLAAWKAYLTQRISRELAKIRNAGLPANGEELNRWYTAVPDSQNAALVLTQAFALRQVYSDSRSNLINNFKLPKRGVALTPEQVELLRGYLVLNQACRDKADEALRLPASRYPVDFTMLMSTLLPHLAWLKDIAELHQYEAWLAMQSGEVAPVITNITTMLALTRTLDNEPCLISQVLRLRLVDDASATLERRANTASLSAVEITNLASAFTQTSLADTSVRGLIGDRAMMIPYFRMSRAEYALVNPNPPPAGEVTKPDSPLPCHGPAILRLIGYYELDYGTFLIGMNQAILLARNDPPDNLRVGGYLGRAGAESTKRRRTLSGLTFSGYANITRRENESIAHQRLALTALAVEGFRNDNGKLPGNLDELAPKYFAEVPEDPFTGLDLEYQRKEKGYVIYSVGPDREDNEGLEKVDKKQSDDGKSYDLTFIVER